MNKHEFSEFVYNSRIESQLTLVEFAEELGVDFSTIWRWENKRTCPKPDAMPYWIEKIIEVVDA